MSAFDSQLVAAKAAVVERHLARVSARLPSNVADMKPATDASDVVVLHLWQAVQVVLDLAFAACLHLRLPTPGSYGEAFRHLARDGVIDDALADRLVRAAGFRNAVAHDYQDLDMEMVYGAARDGPADLRAFLAALARLAST